MNVGYPFCRCFPSPPNLQFLFSGLHGRFVLGYSTLVVYFIIKKIYSEMNILNSEWHKIEQYEESKLWNVLLTISSNYKIFNTFSTVEHLHYLLFVFKKRTIIENFRNVFLRSLILKWLAYRFLFTCENRSQKPLVCPFREFQLE